MRRLTWFFAGFLMALIGGGYAKRRVRAAATQLTPSKVAVRAKGRLTGATTEVRSRFSYAVSEGRTAMYERESELQPKA
jgi:hypothetical protein